MNQIIQQVQAKTLERVDQRLRPVVAKIVDTGKKLMYSDQTRHMLIDQLRQGTDPENIGAGIAKLLGVLFNQSHNTIPMQAGIPAATLLLCEVLQFLEESGKVKVDADFVAQCTQAMGSAILQLFGVTPDKLQSMVNKSAGQPGQQAAAPPGPPGIVAGAPQGAM